MSKVTYKDGAYNTYGDLPTVGGSAPEVSLVNTRLQDVSLASFGGMRKIMNIFVSIDRPICAMSVEKFDRYGDGRDDIAMLMISYDLPFAHKRFAEEHKLKNVIGLSAIRHAGFGENYGVLITEGPLAGMYARAIVVLDENDTIVYHEYIEDIAREPNYKAAFRALGIELDDE